MQPILKMFIFISVYQALYTSPLIYKPIKVEKIGPIFGAWTSATKIVFV